MLNWDEIEEAVRGCEACRLCSGRHNAVPGEGRRDADIMLIGEGPGEQEDLSGRPFVGPAGQLLERMLASIGLGRGDVFIGNVVKCRPPQNRDPKPEETACCIGYLSRQLEIIKPKIIVCLGRVAATILIDKGFKVTRQHGEWFNKDGVWYMGTFHPAALLRNPHNKPDAFEDMLALQSKIREICTHTYDGTEL